MARTDVDGYGNLYASFAACYDLVLDSLGRDRDHFEVVLAQECSPLPDASEDLVRSSQDLPESREILGKLKRTFPVSTTSVEVRFVDPDGEIMRCLDSKVIYPSLRQRVMENSELVERTLRMAALFDVYMNERVPAEAREISNWKDHLPKLEEIPPEAAQAGGALLGLALEVFGELWQQRPHNQDRTARIAYAIKSAETEG